MNCHLVVGLALAAQRRQRRDLREDEHAAVGRRAGPRGDDEVRGVGQGGPGALVRRHWQSAQQSRWLDPMLNLTFPSSKISISNLKLIKLHHCQLATV